MILCDKCKTKEAVVHRIVITNGKKHAQHFCHECALQSGLVMIKLPTFAELAGTVQTSEIPAKTCVCSHTFSDFQKTGVLGCSSCYETFKEELMPIISNAQLGRTQHQGRTNISNSEEKEDTASLQKLLDEAVAAENYEEAAVLRDKIRALMRSEQEEIK